MTREHLWSPEQLRTITCYSNHLNIRQVRYSNGPNASGPVLEWGSENQTTKVCLWYKMSGVGMVRLIM